LRLVEILLPEAPMVARHVSPLVVAVLETDTS
jgi:hypothetical protein